VAAALLLSQAESYYDLPSWTDDEDELAEEQQQPAGSTDGSVAAEAADEAEVEAPGEGAADSLAAAAAIPAVETTATAAVAAGPIPQQEAAASCLPAALPAGLQDVTCSQQQPGQQVGLVSNGKAIEPGSLSSSDSAVADRQQQQHETAQLQAHVHELQQQQGVAEKLPGAPAAGAVGGCETHSGSGVADAVAADGIGQPTPVRPVKRYKVDPGTAE
jgi:hypothetical protein